MDNPMEPRREKIFLVAVAIVILALGAQWLQPKTKATALISAVVEPPPQMILSVPVVPAAATNTAISGNIPVATLTAQENTPASADFSRVSDDPPPAITAQAALVADLETGDLYLNQNPNKRWPLASLTKLMTAVIASENADLGKPITLTSEDFTSLSYWLSKIEAPGNTYSGGDLLTLMLLPSSNEAAHAFARDYGYDAFIKLMNDQASSWGMQNSYFADSSGLSASNQSTAADLKVLAMQIAAHNPGIFEITRNAKRSVLELHSNQHQLIASINDFAGTPNFLGGKTGSTPEADGNLLSVFSYGGRQVLVIVLGTADRFGETKKLLTWFEHDFRRSN